jgi:ABC-type transport system involved in cytochrome c biogenesis permease subunit
MILLGIIHISLLVLACFLYLFLTLKSFSGEISYRLLTFTNTIYLIGLVLGMFWAKIAWGYYLNLDIKIILSILLFIPFLIENIIKTKKPYLLITGSILIILNYLLPLVIESYHRH